jgi:hypothetical protein
MQGTAPFTLLEVAPMIRKTLAFGSAMVLAASLSAAAQSATTKPAAQAAPAQKSSSKPAAAPAKPAKTTTLVATGKISKFDATTNTLTLTTAKGDVSFGLTDKTPLKEDAKTIQLSALSGLAGHDVRVQYAEKDGAKTVQSVRVTGAMAKSKSSKK